MPRRSRPAMAASERTSAPRLPDAGHRLLVPRLILLFLAGCLLFGTPALWPTGATAGARIGGVPVLYVALFAAWAAFIAVLGWLVESATGGLHDGAGAHEIADAPTAPRPEDDPA